jgi:hypothetical protein
MTLAPARAKKPGYLGLDLSVERGLYPILAKQIEAMIPDSLKSILQTGKASAAVVVKDLRPLRGARGRASLTAILAAARSPAMGACRSLSLKETGILTE